MKYEPLFVFSEKQMVSVQFAIGTAAMAEKFSKPATHIRVQLTEKPLTYTVPKYFFNKLIAFVIGPKPITMGYVKVFVPKISFNR